MNDLIKQLKEPKQAQPFGLLSKEKQIICEIAGKKNCSLYTCDGWVKPSSGAFSRSTAYILKPDYQPDPEYVDLEIDIEDVFYGVWRTDDSAFLPYPFTSLHCLPSLPGFYRFFLEDAQTLHLEHIAERIHNGAKVYARFRKGEQQ